jgi:hypothetical protein
MAAPGFEEAEAAEAVAVAAVVGNPMVSSILIGATAAARMDTQVEEAEAEDRVEERSVGHAGASDDGFAVWRSLVLTRTARVKLNFKLRIPMSSAFCRKSLTRITYEYSEHKQN